MDSNGLRLLPLLFSTLLSLACAHPHSGSYVIGQSRDLISSLQSLDKRASVECGQSGDVGMQTCPLNVCCSRSGYYRRLPSSGYHRAYHITVTVVRHRTFAAPAAKLVMEAVGMFRGLLVVLAVRQQCRDAPLATTSPGLRLDHAKL